MKVARCLSAMMPALCIALWSASSLAQWTRVPLPSPNGRLLAAFPVSGGAELLFASTTEGGAYGLFRSVDAGATWQPLTVTGHAGAFIASLQMRPGPESPPSPHLYATTLVDANGPVSFCDVVTSTDLGTTWTTRASRTTVCALAEGVGTDAAIFGYESGSEVASLAARLFRSTDDGSTWTPVSAGLPQEPVRRATVGYDGTLVVLTPLQVAVSRDAGSTWKASPLPAFTDYRPLYFESRTLPSTVAVRPDGRGGSEIVAGSTTGVYRSADGESWQPLALQGFFVTSVTQVLPSSSDLVLVFRGGAALLRGDALLPYSTGLPDPLVASTDIYRCKVSSSCIGGSLPSTAWLIEYYNAILDHYFMTVDPAEAAAIDAGRAGAGWSRTGHQYLVYASVLGTNSSEVNPACRFYGTPGRGPNSHFFSVDAGECLAVTADAGWSLETRSAFAAPVPAFSPVAQTGTCNARTAIYRLYNNRAAQNDSNHRYTADFASYQAMKAKGWIDEGVRLCAIR